MCTSTTPSAPHVVIEHQFHENAVSNQTKISILVAPFLKFEWFYRAFSLE